MKLKNKWNKLKSWQKGGIIGFIVGIILFILNHFLFLGALGIGLVYPIIGFLTIIINYTNFWGMRGCGESCWYKWIIIGDFVIPIVSVLIGILIGFLISRRRKK